MNTDRNLLFGVLALQMDFVSRDALIAAMNAWVLQKSTPLDQILLAHGALRSDAHSLLEALVQKHLEVHGGDAQKSLAAVSSVGSLRQELERIGDDQLHASLVHLAAGRGGADPYATVGTPTSSGLRFRILRPHARGGLGEVFVALDAELHREVALKEIQGQHADDPASRARFLLEAEVTGGLEHPGIVPVYGLGQYGDGRPYYAMRFIPGDSLQEAIARFHKADQGRRDPGERALSLRQLLGRFVDVCDAIAYAHSRGVLHRDLKPGNVMLGPFGETLVVDWGLAKPMGARALEEGGTVLERPLQPKLSGSTAPTQMGSALGTPAYMPPEQAAGQLDQLGPASDVYSLGAMLYCLLTGRSPFGGEDVEEVLRKVQAGDFPSPRLIKRHVPAALEAICLKAMALQPSGRYSSCRALAADVERWLADEPVLAYPEALPVRLARWARRHRSAVLTAAAVLLVAVAGLTVSTFLISRERDRAEQARRLADDAAEDARNQHELADRQRRQAEANFALAREAVDRNFTQVTRNKVFDNPELIPLRKALLQTALGFYQRFASTQRTDLATRAELGKAHQRLADVLKEMGAFKEAGEQYRLALSIHEPLAGEHPDVAAYQDDLARCHFGLGELYSRTAQPVRAEAAHRKALAIWDQAKQLADGPPGQEETMALCEVGLGWASSHAGHTAEAEQAYQSALARWEKLDRDHPHTAYYQDRLANCLRNLGQVYADTGRRPRAEALFLRAAALYEQLIQANAEAPYYRSALETVLDVLGGLYIDTKQWDRAEKAYQRAVTLVEGLAYPKVRSYEENLARIYTNLGRVYYYNGRLDEAEKRFKQSLPIAQAIARRNRQNPYATANYAITYLQLGKVYRDTGRRDKASEALDEALAISEKLVHDHSKDIWLAKVLARMYEARGKLHRESSEWGAALERYDMGLTTLDRLFRQEPRDKDGRRYLHEIREGRAIVLTQLGRHAEALRDWDEAVSLEASADRPPPNDPTPYRTACLFARTAAALLRQTSLPEAERTELSRQYADRAAALLVRTRSLGYFDDPAHRDALRKDADLAPLRGREDVKKLLAEVERQPASAQGGKP